MMAVEVATFTAGQRPMMVSHRGVTHVLAPLDREMCFANGEAWEAGIRPPQTAPTMAEGAAGNVSGEWRFCVRLYRRRNQVYSIPSPLAKSGSDRSLDVTLKKITVTFGETTLDEYDEWHVLAHQANIGYWATVGKVPFGTTEFSFDVDLDEYLKYPLALADDRGFFDDHIPPSCNFGIVWQGRLWRCGQEDVTLDATSKGTILLSNERIEPDPFVEADDQVRGVATLLAADASSGWNGSEAYKQLEFDTRDDVYSVDLPVSGTRLRLHEAVTDNRTSLAALNNGSGVYYLDNGDGTITWYLDTNLEEILEIGDYIDIADATAQRAASEGATIAMQVTDANGTPDYVTARLGSGQVLSAAADASTWSGQQVYVHSGALTGTLVGRNWIWASRVDGDGECAEVAPPLNIQAPAELGALMPRGMSVYNDTLIVFTEEGVFQGMSDWSSGVPNVVWRTLSTIGMASPWSMVSVPTARGSVLREDIIFAGHHGLHRFTRGTVVDESNRLGIWEWWRGLDAESLRESVGAWDAENGVYLLKNVALGVDPTKTHYGVMWDAINDEVVFTGQSYVTAFGQVADSDGRFQVVEGDSWGFLGVGQKHDLFNREVLLDSEYRAGTRNAGYSGTFGEAGAGVSGFVVAGTPFPTTGDGLKGAWCFIKYANWDLVAHRIASNTASSIAFEDNLGVEAVAGDQYVIGGSYIVWTSGVMGGQDSLLKQLSGGVQVSMAGPSSGQGETFLARFSIWQADEEIDIGLILSGTRNSVAITKALLSQRGQGVMIPGCLSRAFVFNLEGIFLNDDVRVSRIRVPYRVIDSAWIPGG